MSVELWIPPSAAPTHRCHCGKAYRLPDERRAYVEHVSRCVRSQADDIQAEVAARAENFDPLDPEMWEWGRKREAEGLPGFHRGRAA